ncbi:MAG: histidinol dehydrogenase [Treponema sp.]|jgi:histidinol dehydrogenase|nr:histidinol dehydrogenase [Treponema sp.]
MGLVKIIGGSEFKTYFAGISTGTANVANDIAVNAVVNEIIAAVRSEGDAAVRRYATQLFHAGFEKSVPEKFEVPLDLAKEAWENLTAAEPELAAALIFAADNLRRFAALQKGQFRDFEEEIAPGLFAGQRIIPVEKAAIYTPGGRFPLISSALMGLIPARVAGVGELALASPPGTNGLPDQRILAVAHLAGVDRIFALGGAQAIAALALGTETVPRVDLIAGPGNKYVVAAKRMLFGEVGIDLLPGPTDVLIITDTKAGAASAEEAANLIAEAADLIAADMLAQAEHDPDARARALVPDREMAELIKRALEKHLGRLPTAETARASLEAGGLIVVYQSRDEAVSIANEIAPEHLELHIFSPDEWIPDLRNYGSLFIGPLAAEVLGDYSAGINHTLPTSTSARFSGGLSVRHFLKTVTTLRCAASKDHAKALQAAETIARAEGLAAHAESAALRRDSKP